MRTFIALNLPAAARAALHSALAPLRERGWPVRWVPAANLHLTLRFLGDVEGVEVERLEDVLRGLAAQHAPVALEIAGFGAFPSLRRANVLWVGIAQTRELMALQREVELATSRLGYGRDPKPFRPHITVARLSGGARPLDVERSAGDLEYGSSLEVGTMDLMRSHLGGEGASYEALTRFRLGGQVTP